MVRCDGIHPSTGLAVLDGYSDWVYEDGLRRLDGWRKGQGQILGPQVL